MLNILFSKFKKSAFLEFFILLKYISSLNLFLRISVYLLFSLTASLGELISAFLISNFLVEVVGYQEIPGLIIQNKFLNPYILILFVLITGLLRFSSLFILPRLSTLIGTRITAVAFKKYLHLSLENREKYKLNELQTTFSLRSSQLTGGVISTSLNILNYFLIFFIFILFLSIKQPIITVLILLIIFTLYIITNFISKNSRNLHTKIMNIYNQYLVAFIDSSLRDSRFAYFNFQNKKVLNEYKILDYKLRKSSTQLTFIGTLPKIFVESLFYIGILFVVGLILKFNMDSDVTISNLILLFVCFQRLLPAIQGIYANLLSLRSNLPVVSYFLSFIKNKTEFEEKSEYLNNENNLQNKYLENKILETSPLTYLYKNSNQVISYPRIKVCKGEFVLIKGISGKGKSTWIDLMFNLRKPNSGEIIFFNNSISKIFLSSSVSKDDINYLHKSYFIKLSKIDKEITINEKYIKEIKEICKINFLSIEDLKKENNFINKGFSSGQLQRMQLFLALLQKPSILILDEALNAIEVELEKKILLAIKHRFAHLSLIQISHRNLNEEIYDLIYTL